MPRRRRIRTAVWHAQNRIADGSECRLAAWLRWDDAVAGSYIIIESMRRGAATHEENDSIVHYRGSGAVGPHSFRPASAPPGPEAARTAPASAAHAPWPKSEFAI